MELRQRIELRHHMVAELRQSLNILALPLLEIKNLVENELETNPLLEESAPPKDAEAPLPFSNHLNTQNLDFRINLITKRQTLQDVLLRQLGMFTNTDEDFQIGQEIIGNIDENGYLKATLEEIASTLKVTPEKAENVLKLIQGFEPAGVGAKSVSECLLIQLELAGEKDPLLLKIVQCHLEDVAKKNYTLIAKTLKRPLDKIEPMIKKILKLDPKPGRNYTLDETQRVIPDIVIEETDEDEDLKITINNEDIPNLNISETYRQMLKKTVLTPKPRNS